jgi:hypothetical protein
LFVFVFGGRYFLPDGCDPYTALLQTGHPIAEIKDAAPKFDITGLTLKVDDDGLPVGDTYMSWFDIDAKEVKDRLSECQPFVLDGSV